MLAAFHNRLLALTALALCAPAPALAQDAPAAPPPPPTFRLPMLGVARANSLLPLIRRADVQKEIRLTLQQKDALADVLDPAKQQIQLHITADQNSTAADRRKQIEDQITAQLGAPEEKIKAALRPDQYDRLVQLLCQWRGPLILSDTQVAAKLRVAPERRADIAKAAAEYERVKQEVMASLTQQTQQDSPDGSKRAVMMRVDTSDLSKPLSPAYKKLSAAKRQAEDVILAALSPDERAAWKSAQGAPFAFRQDLPGNRF